MRLLLLRDSQLADSLAPVRSLADLLFNWLDVEDLVEFTLLLL